jgi:hypothetical protein
MSVALSFSGSDQVVLSYVRSRVEKLVTRLVKQLDRSMIQLQSYIVQNELSGQILAHRSGKLAGSINAIPAKAVGSTLEGKVEGAGGAAWYGQVQEKGGTKKYEIAPVNKKALAFFPGGSVGGAIQSGFGIVPGKGALKSLYSRRSLNPAMLSQFGQMGGVVLKKVIHPPLPKRPFMSTGLAAMRETIVADLQKAIAGTE